MSVYRPIRIEGSRSNSWEDQIVPTLRERLQHESAYLDSRLSLTFDHRQQSDEITPGGSRERFGYDRISSRVVDDVPSFQNTTGGFSGHDIGLDSYRAESSSMGIGGMGSGSGKSRIPVPIHSVGSPRSRTRSSPFQNSPPTDYSPRLESTMLQRDHSTDRETHGANQRLTRPRSKSQLASRPSLPFSSEEPLPSNLPRPVRKTSSPDKAGAVSQPSPPLPPSAIVEGFIKNELPPFQLYPEEAMRIAERGYDLDSVEDGYAGGDGDGWEDHHYTAGSLSKSKSMTGDRVPKRDLTRNPSYRNGEDDSGSIVRIGNGYPSTHKSNTQSQTRSSCAKHPQTSNSYTPRSASMGILSSTITNPLSSSTTNSKFLGVAAHFVPPENTYTPPKGANWDEVVLPTVAKKLGIQDNTPVKREGEEGDLAVEWDKNGTPIKWVKKGVLSSSQSSNTGLMAGEPTRPPFSTSFEPSPDNPLRHQSSRSVLAPPSSRSNSRTGSIRHKQSSEYMGQSTPTPTPIRTVQGEPTEFHNPPSHAPFSDLAPLPPGHIPQSHNNSMSRRPSTLRKNMPSQNSLRSNQGGQIPSPYRHPSAQKSSGNYFDNPRPGPSVPVHQGGSSNMISEAAYGRSRGESTQMQKQVGGKQGKGSEDHGKGCGCVIM